MSLRSSRLSKAWRIWRRHLQPLALIVLILTSFRSAVADWNDVPTGSMKPAILEGDRIFVNKLAYGLKLPYTTWHLAHWSAPARGEIVVFNSPADGIRLVKRIVGLPGDRIELIDNILSINGRPAAYGPLPNRMIAALSPAERPSHGFATETIAGMSHPVMSTPALRGARRTFGPIIVPQGEYFMMGDNRDNSLDSRYWGTVPRDQILGRASAIALSLDYDHHYLPRWERFFKGLE